MIVEIVLQRELAKYWKRAISIWDHQFLVSHTAMEESCLKIFYNNHSQVKTGVSTMLIFFHDEFYTYISAYIHIYVCFITITYIFFFFF